MAGASAAAPTDAVGRAAHLLGAARRPAIGGLGCDVDGVRAALRLAARIGAMVDHAASAHERVELRTVADSGLMTTTGTETRHRADLVVFAGPRAVAWADAAKSLDDGGGLYPWRGTRGVLCLSTGGARPGHVAVDGTVAAFGDDLPLHRTIALLRARLAGRPLGDLRNGPGAEAVDAVALQMTSAAFGVVVVDPADVDHVTFDALGALVKTLNNQTRFSTLVVPAHHHGRGANFVAAWTTGGQLPVGLGRGYPEQDSWRFDVGRAVAAGEADALLWIGALGPDLPGWAGRVPTVALLHHGARASTADVVIEVGVPGVTHAGVLADAVRDGFTLVEPRAPQDLPSVASVLAAIEAALAEGRP